MTLDQLNILYVEDDEFSLNNIELLCSHYVKNFYKATNGKDGLKVYEEKKPDVILTDIKMPIMNGIEMVNKIRKKDKNTKIILISAYDEKEYILNGLEARIDGILTKPFDIEDLKKTILSNDIPSIYKEEEFGIFNHHFLKIKIEELDNFFLNLITIKKRISKKDLYNAITNLKKLKKDIFLTNDLKLVILSDQDISKEIITLTPKISLGIAKYPEDTNKKELLKIANKNIVYSYNRFKFLNFLKFSS